MKITACTVRDFKRIREVTITPEADRFVILIGGANAQGKTSLLDALTATFGGGKAVPADPVRHGAESAEIRVELDDGALTIRRLVDADGKSQLEVRDLNGKVRTPQAVLDALVGARFLDPLAFLALPAKDQRAALLELVADAQRIAGLDAKRAAAFEKRTDVARDLRKAEAELERLPATIPVAPIDVGALIAEKEAIAVRAQLAREWTGAQAELAEARSAVQKAAERLALADSGFEKAELRLADLPPPAPWREAEIVAELGGAQAHNAKVAADAAAAARRVEVAAEVAEAKAAVTLCTESLGKIDARKAEILAAAKLPVPGLGIDDNGVTLDGVPLAQASGAERLRVALALAIAASPNLGDVWIRDGALLDEDSLALVAEHAERAGVRVWVERVGNRDPGAIVIQDGRVAEGRTS